MSSGKRTIKSYIWNLEKIMEVSKITTFLIGKFEFSVIRIKEIIISKFGKH